MTRCPKCGAENAIVNLCGCDPQNLPTRVPDIQSPQEQVMADEKKVHIIWYGMGGELDSVTATESGAMSALIRMLQGNVLSAGDTIEVREVE